MSQALIRKAFETRLATWAAAQTPPLPLAYQNAAFVAPAPTAANAWGRYARVFVLPGTTGTNITGDYREYVGIFQVSLALGQNLGSREAEMLAASLDATFPPAGPFTADGFNVWLTGPMTPVAPIGEPDRYVVSVSAPYKAAKFTS